MLSDLEGLWDRNKVSESFLDLDENVNINKSQKERSEVSKVYSPIPLKPQD